MTLSRRNLIIAAGLLMFGGLGTVDAFGGYPANYYNSLNGKCGPELMDAIKQMAAGHKEISYGDATWRAFRSTDIKIVNGQEYWWDMYSNNLVSTDGHSGMNIEHSVANSWWDGTKNAAYKDLVHLNPSDATANNRKSNYPLGIVSGTPTYENGVTFVGHPTSDTGGGSNYVYEPADEYKGDFARVFMYMFCAYKDMQWGTRFTWMYDTSNPLMFKPWAQELLLSWSSLDAVSQKERDRNDGVQKEQGNRNPFIDLPDLAEHIWGNKQNVPYDTGTGGDDPDDPENPDDPKDQNVFNWLGENDPDGDAGWDFDIVSMDPDLSYVWQWKSYTEKNKPTKYYMNGSAYMDGAPYAAKAYVWGPEVDMTDVETATFSFDHAAKFQTTLKDLCKVAVMDMNVNSNDLGYIKTYEIPSWPVSGQWVFSNSGDIDLSEYGKTGSKIRVGFKYRSTTSGADTWEVRNAKLTLTRRQGSGIGTLPADEIDDSILVEVWGNNIIVPEGAVIFDLNGRQCSGENLSRGIYIVTKPTFRKAVKVMVK